MKSDVAKFTKLMGILAEMYSDDPKYCIDCFFDAYFQFRKKNAVDLYCSSNPQYTPKQVWATINFYQSMGKKGQPVEDALIIACKHYETDIVGIRSLIQKFQAFRSLKKTKFKDLL